MKSDYDVIIIGAGTMGMAAGYFLAKQGVRTLLIDAHLPPHEMGSHHGDTRIIRLAYGDGDLYVPLIKRAYELWHQLEEESQNQIFARTGALSLGRPGANVIMQGLKSAKRFDLPLELLDSDEIMKRWPGISAPDDYVGCWEPTAGVLFSENCLRSYRDMALSYPAAQFLNAKADDISLFRDGCSVRTSEGTYRADRLIVCAGAWSGKLLADLRLPLQPVRKTIAWFDADDALYRPSAFPAFLVSDADKFYYGFPSFDRKGVKVGRHDSGRSVDPDTMNREFGSFPEDEGDVREFMNKFMPQAANRIRTGKVCIYTLTPDEHFIIDKHPEYPHVSIAAGFSGHGFKFGSVVGEALSQLAVNGQSKHDVSPFSLRRFQSVK